MYYLSSVNFKFYYEDELDDIPQSQGPPSRNKLKPLEFPPKHSIPSLFWRAGAQENLPPFIAQFHHDNINTQHIVLQSLWKYISASYRSVTLFYNRYLKYMHRLPLKKCNRLAITEKGARPRASPPPHAPSYEWWLIDPNNTTQWTHPHATNISDITIDPNNTRGNLAAALRTADAIKGLQFMPRRMIRNRWYLNVHLLNIHCNGHSFQYPWVHRHSILLERRW